MSLSKQTITLSKDLLPPPFGNHHLRNGFPASSPTSLASPETKQAQFQCLISTSTSHTLVEKSLVDRFNSLSPPFRWVEDDAKNFHPKKRFSLGNIHEASSKEPEDQNNSPSFNFTEFSERERDNYRFQCFVGDSSFSEYTQHLKVVGSFDFCFTTSVGTGACHFFRIEKAIVIDGDLFINKVLEPGTVAKEPFRAVLGRSFLENHPHLMLEAGEDSGFVLSSTLLGTRSPIIDTHRIDVAETSHTALVIYTAGICHSTALPGKDSGGYGVFFRSGSSYNTFRHLPASHGGVRDVDFRPEGAVGFGNAAPKEPATLDRAELSAVLLAMKMAIRLKVLEHDFDHVIIRTSSKYCNAVFSHTDTVGANNDLIAQYIELTRAFVQRGLTLQNEPASPPQSHVAHLLAHLGQEMWPYTGAMSTVQESLPVHSHYEYEKSRTPSPLYSSDQDSPNTSNERFFFPNVQTDIYAPQAKRKSRSCSMDMTDMAELLVRRYSIARNLLPAGRLMWDVARGNFLSLTTCGLYFIPVERAMKMLEDVDMLTADGVDG